MCAIGMGKHIQRTPVSQFHGVTKLPWMRLRRMAKPSSDPRVNIDSVCGKCVP